MVLLLWHRPYIFRHVDFMSCHGFSTLGTEPVLGPPIPKRLQWFRLTDQKLGNVFDAKRKDGDGLGLSLPRRRSHSGVRHAFTRTRDEPLRTSAWEATLAYNRLCNQCPISSTFSQGSLSSSLGTTSWDSLNQICGTPWLFTIYMGKSASSIYRKTAAKAWTLYQRWLWRNGTRIAIFQPGKTGPFQMFRCSRKFHLGRPKKSCSIYFPTGFPGKLL